MAKGQIVAGLDIGTNTIKALVIQKRNKEWEVSSFREIPSFGLRKGAVVNTEEVSKRIQELFLNIEKDCARKINSVFVNINGSHIYTTPSDGIVSVSRANQIISQEDIDRVLQATKAINISQNDEVLDVIPREFIIDDQKGIRNPLNLKGVRLEAKALLLCVFSHYFVNLTQSVLNSKIQINDVIPSPIASSEAVLTPQQKELGVAIVDIGAGTTSLAVFEEGELIHLAVFPIGSANITNDIAIGFKTDIDTAEKIKKQHGLCIMPKLEKKDNKLLTDKKKIEISDTASPLSFSKKDLFNIIEPRVSEIIDLIAKELKKIGKQELLPCGIVLTGGGSKIPKLKDFVKEQLKLPVEIGKVKNILGIEDDTSLTVVAGLALSGTINDADEKENTFGFIKKIFLSLKKILKSFIP